jgi:uncharacterized protein (DUF1697 family)
VPRYVAFLRAINVGGHTVKMETLRALFEGLRFKNVSTFIASGNVLFDADRSDPAALELRIEKHLEKALGYEVGTFLRSTDQVAAVAAYEPFDAARAAAAHTVSVTFLKGPLDAGVRRAIMALRCDTDDFHANQRELYWLTETPMSDSTVARPLLKTLGKVGTMRNLTTVRKLASKCAT